MSQRRQRRWWCKEGDSSQDEIAGFRRKLIIYRLRRCSERCKLCNFEFKLKARQITKSIRRMFSSLEPENHTQMRGRPTWEFNWNATNYLSCSLICHITKACETMEKVHEIEKSTLYQLYSLLLFLNIKSLLFVVWPIEGWVEGRKIQAKKEKVILKGVETITASKKERKGIEAPKIINHSFCSLHKVSRVRAHKIPDRNTAHRTTTIDRTVTIYLR